jgi:hypothetical protein
LHVEPIIKVSTRHVIDALPGAFKVALDDAVRVRRLAGCRR